MLDFSLPLATGVLPIEGHDLLGSGMPNNYFSISLPAATQVNINTTDSPTPPKPTN